MAVDFKNLQASTDIAVLKIDIGVPYLSSDFRNLVIPYVGTADPASSAVTLSKAQYSLNSGATWLDMTAAPGVITTGLTFSTIGTSLSYTWRARNDIGARIYNTTFMIRFQATAGGFTSLFASKNVFFDRVTNNLSSNVRTQDPFPSDYSGMPGWDLLRNAPS